MKLYLCAVLSAALALAGCSTTPATLPDGGKDSTVGADLGDLGKGEGGGKLDQGPPVPAGCEKTCVSQARYLCLTDSKSGLCVECTADKHCTGNPGALGNKCDPTSMYCACATAADCAGKIHGAACHATFKMCSCRADSDCVSPLKCVGTLFGASVCAAPCKADADCLSTSSDRCDAKTGRCLQCLTDSDCAGDSAGAYCHATLGKCVACRQDTHCASTAKTPYCDAASGKCAECSSASHCTGYMWGNACLTDSGAGKLCRCQSSADCKGNPNGPTCFTKYRKCSCASNADCKTVPYTLCLPPYSGATYKNCHKACASDADCSSASAPRCDTGSGLCVACLADADCLTPAAPVCNKTSRKCVACLTDAHCAGNQNGTSCASYNCTCQKDTDCVGVHVWGGKCSTSYKRCACSGAGSCTGNSNGPVCYAKYSKCSCASDAECSKAPYSKCSPAYATATYNNCQKPCLKDSDCDTTLKCLTGGKCGLCASDADCAAPNKLCDVSKARCVACKTSADCPGGKVCDGSTGQCVECKVDADCATNLDGGKCSSGTCGCAADADCKTGYAWGDTCNSSYKRCACLGNTGCTANANGSVCLGTYKKCTCTKDADCTNKGFTRCLAAYNGAVYKHCQKPCASDKDCPATTAPHCQVATGKCRACTGDAHCAANPFARKCDTAASFACVECLASTDCGAHSLGTTCAGKLCSCARDADCSKQQVGPWCNTYNKACGCKADTDCATTKKCTGATGFGTKYCK